jgi:chromosome segregation ATPase
MTLKSYRGPREIRMQEIHTSWLRDDMRDHLANGNPSDAIENVLSFQRRITSGKNPGEAALELVWQAAELIGDVDSFAAERLARAEKLAQQAIEKLKIADDRVRSAESERRTVIAEMNEFRDKVEKEVSDKLQEMERAMEQTASRVAAAEAKLSTAEQRARAAESRANEAENALRRVEAAIRSKIIAKMPTNSGGRIATAA